MKSCQNRLFNIKKCAFCNHDVSIYSFDTSSRPFPYSWPQLKILTFCKFWPKYQPLSPHNLPQKYAVWNTTVLACKVKQYEKSHEPSNTVLACLKIKKKRKALDLDRWNLDLYLVSRHWQCWRWSIFCGTHFSHNMPNTFSTDLFNREIYRCLWGKQNKGGVYINSCRSILPLWPTVITKWY